MNSFRSLSRSKPRHSPLAPDNLPEQAVMVHILLSDNEFGSEDEIEEIEDLCDELEEAIERRKTGELDGYEYGEGECVIFIYGPDADDLFASIEPILKKEPMCRGGHAIKRYGEAGDPYCREEKIYL